MNRRQRAAIENVLTNTESARDRHLIAGALRRVDHVDRGTAMLVTILAIDR